MRLGITQLVSLVSVVLGRVVWLLWHIKNGICSSLMTAFLTLKPENVSQGSQALLEPSFTYDIMRGINIIEVCKRHENPPPTPSPTTTLHSPFFSNRPEIAYHFTITHNMPWQRYCSPRSEWVCTSNFVCNSKGHCSMIHTKNRYQKTLYREVHF